MKITFKLAIAAFAVVLFTISANAQEWKDHWTDYIWTNGSETVCSVRLNKSQVLLVGNGYMDAGYGYLFEVKSLGGTNYDMKGIPESAVKERPQNLDDIVKTMLDEEYCNGDDGEVWKRREVEGHDLLIRYDDNSIMSVYVPTGREMKEVVDDDFCDIIAGSYASTKGKKYQFNNDGTCVFDGVTTNYSMVDEGDNGTPSLHITVNNQLWELEPTADGMKIYKAFHRPDAEGPFQGELFATLKVSKNTPRWSFLSDRVCTEYAVANLNKDVMRVMRNEMYARQGYRFSDKKLQAYFESCKWYKPAEDNSKVKLSEVENLNVAVIKYCEQ